MSKNKQMHQVESFGNMVSKAALAQLKPHIDQQVQDAVQNANTQLTTSLTTAFIRMVAVERVLVAKGLCTAEELIQAGYNIEDERDDLVQVENVQPGDQVRIEIKTKLSDQETYQGSSRLKVRNVGFGATLGADIEPQMLGMKVGESKEITFGEDKGLTALVKIDRISRQPIVEKAPISETPAETGALSTEVSENAN